MQHANTDQKQVPLSAPTGSAPVFLQACAQRPPMDSDVLPQSRVLEPNVRCNRASLLMMFTSNMLCPMQACEDPPDAPTPVRQARNVR